MSTKRNAPNSGVNCVEIGVTSPVHRSFYLMSAPVLGSGKDTNQTTGRLR